MITMFIIMLVILSKKWLKLSLMIPLSLYIIFYKKEPIHFVSDLTFINAPVCHTLILILNKKTSSGLSRDNFVSPSIFLKRYSKDWRCKFKILAAWLTFPF